MATTDLTHRRALTAFDVVELAGMFALTIARALTLVGAPAALLVALLVGGPNTLFDSTWATVAIVLAAVYVTSSALFFAMARFADRRMNRWRQRARGNTTRTAH
ncbi:hypothetical protein [Microbacterium sp. 77mftsu3.1]|uniref:hypothetical protein n=1 Tax=Microbacterium sp. 77mftsu3.1 TaxID=1761802 RepID=UPI00037C5447|nr:hypothetical protein [Microbacterium sp. 77mftsu3.1]SDH38226.1 hypothetical protein SAMN04488590_3189 [Microbacterium sp. 77mftsu3.1]